MSWRLGAVVAVALGVSAPARAQTLAVNVGAIDVVGLPPQHLGFYPYAGVSVAFSSGPLSFIPAVALEFSPDQTRWGAVLTLTFDYSIKSWMGVDLNLGLIHDMEAFNFAGPAFASSVFFLGGGPGVTFLFGKWSVSPGVNLFHGLNVPGWALVPALNVGYSF